MSVDGRMRMSCDRFPIGWRVLATALFVGSIAPIVAAADEAGLAINYVVREAGNVSIAVYDTNGRMVRPVLYGEPHRPGEYMLSWDGLDRYGDPLPPGQYEWRLLRTPGFSREFLVNVGINTPWSPFDIWPGNHFGPSVVKVDEDDVLYVGSESSEGPPHLLKMALDGNRKYWDTGTWGLADGLRGLERIGDVLYLQMGTLLDVRRVDNGQKFWGIPKLRRFADKSIPFADLLHAGDDRAKKKDSPISLAGGKDFLAVSYRDHDEIRFLWPVEDQIDREKSVTVPTPGALAVSSAGQVLVVSGSDVVQADVKSGQVVTIVREVSQPGKIAYDPLCNDLLVVCGGKCIRRYHVPDGQLIAVYGRPEGRTYGLFNPLDFDDLLDITADRKGGFVTVEQYPRRVAHFRGREKHEVVNQWFGGMQWGSEATIDPADPTIVYLPIDPRHLGRGKIDYEAKSWTLTHLYGTVDHGSWNVGNVRHRDILPVAGELNFWEARHVDGQTFLLNRGAGVAQGSVTVLRVDEQANQLFPVAHLGGLHPTLDRQKPPEWWLQVLKRKGVKNPATFETAGGYKHFAFSWSDRNGNALVDNEEISLASVGTQPSSGSCFVSPNWDVVCPIGKNGDGWMEIPNEGTLQAPIWNWDHGRRGQGRFSNRESAVVHPGPASSIYRDEDGATYVTLNNVPMSLDQADVPPLTWPNNKNHSSRFVKWNARGSQVFSAGSHTGSKKGEPGVFSDVRAILGEVRECLVVMDACSPASVWTRDGLYAGAFNDNVGMSSEPEGWRARAFLKIAHDDNLWGQVLQTADGDVLWGPTRDNNTPYYRITGWDRWERQSGQLALQSAAPGAHRDGTGLTGEFFGSIDLSGEPRLRRTDREIGFGQIGGDHRIVPALHPWFAGAEKKRLGLAEAFSVRWTGSLEAPLTEKFTFRVYLDGDGRDKSGARVRLWIADKLAIDSWDEISPEKFGVDGLGRREAVSPPITLEAGKRIPIKIEHASPGGQAAHMHLYWESRSFDLRHVPVTYLYPVGASAETGRTARGRS